MGKDETLGKARLGWHLSGKLDKQMERDATAAFENDPRLAQSPNACFKREGPKQAYAMLLDIFRQSMVGCWGPGFSFGRDASAEGGRELC